MSAASKAYCTRGKRSYNTLFLSKKELGKHTLATPKERLSGYLATPKEELPQRTPKEELPQRTSKEELRERTWARKEELRRNRSEATLSKSMDVD
jgi:hypothetical protein